MLLDTFGQVCSAQNVTGDAQSEDVLDLDNVTPNRELGSGEPLGFVLSITAIGTTTGSVVIHAAESANADLSSQTNRQGISLATAQIAAGTLYFIDVPADFPTARYFGLYFDITGTVDFTCDAWFSPKSFFQSFQTYASGFTVT